MSDLEISKALALAIGWKEDQISVNGLKLAGSGRLISQYLNVKPYDFKYGRPFDYRDPAVIWPIAKKFDLFPCQVFDDKWVVDWNISDSSFDTPEKAVAMAVIDSMEM